MEVVTERVIHEEKKIKSRYVVNEVEAIATKHQQVFSRGPRCHYFKKFGHIKRYCDELAKLRHSYDKKASKHSAYRAAVPEDCSASETIGLVVWHALSACSTDPHSNGLLIQELHATCATIMI